jgi:hypothetical protein
MKLFSKIPRTTVYCVLFASQDESRSSVRSGGRGSVSESKDLSEGNGLLGAFSIKSGTNIEVARVEEGKDVCCRDRLARDVIRWLARLTGQIAPGEISCREVLSHRGDCSIPSVDDITELSGSDLLPDIRGRKADTNSPESRLKD